MLPAHDPVAIIGTACSLPGGVKSATDFWSVLVHGGWEGCSTPAPSSRAFESLGPSMNRATRAGWLDRAGVEDFDAAFFNITPAEARALRPNCRLSLELTHKALENAGLPPSSLRGTNVAVAIAIGTEDGWDLRRTTQEGQNAVDQNWATNSEPSAVAGRVAHFFDFQGACSTVSNACAGGAFALREGMRSLFLDGADIAVVGAISTHMHPAALSWASAVGVASLKGRCSAFSDDADGYMPSEGAVFFVLKRSSCAQADGNVIDGLIRSVCVGHGGATRTFTTPNMDTQKNIAQRALTEAGLMPSDISFLEAHGTGTKLGDMLEMQAVQAVYAGERDCPLLVSSAKTTVGHCQAAAALVGVLKALLCFKNRAVPPHHVEPREAYTCGNIQVPTQYCNLQSLSKGPLYASVSSFGFTGSIASIVLQEPPNVPRFSKCTDTPSDSRTLTIIPLSAKTEEALMAHIRSVGEWVKSNPCDLVEVASASCLTRDHHQVRRAFVVSDIQELIDRCLSKTLDMDSSPPVVDRAHQPHAVETPYDLISRLNLFQPREGKSHGPVTHHIDALTTSGDVLRAVAMLYQDGHNLAFDHIYTRATISPSVLRSFPTYPFQRKEWWSNTFINPSLMPSIRTGAPVTSIEPNQTPTRPQGSRTDYASACTQISKFIGSMLHLDVSSKLGPFSNIFDAGINSINSIELATNLSSFFGRNITATDLYAFLTVENIATALTSTKLSSVRQGDLQAEFNEFILEFGASLPRDVSRARRGGDGMNILLTGATGTLGSALLACLLMVPGVRVFCPVRGEPFQRLRSGFLARGHSVEALTAGVASGHLHVFGTTDLSEPLLGCSSQDYESLLKTVDTIVHGAWRLDFNLSVQGFRSQFLATRRLAELCAKSDRRITYHFITSFSTSFRFPQESVPEVPLAARVEYALPQGYAIAKLVAEHTLYHIQNQDPEVFSLNIIRIGQICGHSQTGSWSHEEMIPMMLASLPVLKAVPANMPEVSWIPSDVCAEALRDIVVKPHHPPLEVHNVANPHIVPWAYVVESAEPSLKSQIRYVSWAEYVAIIRGNGGRTPISRLLPYFEDSADRLPSCYSNLDVTMTAQKIPSVRTCPQITPAFVQKLYSYISTTFAIERGESASESVHPLKISAVSATTSSAFIFGPWSTKFTPPNDDQTYSSILSLLYEYATEETHELGENFEDDQALGFQLQTLAFQLATFRRTLLRGTRPSAVVGYCFGEFAAAVAAGVLSERSVVSILCHRASALRGVSGAMLNVFSDISSTRAHLAGLSDPPDIGILAGPQHVVLSGSEQQISDAKALLEVARVKTKTVHTSFPYHSRQVDPALTPFAKMRPFTISVGSCIYVSCLTGTAIAHERLGVSYWLRHLREPVRFVSAMRTIRHHLETTRVIIIGPNVGLQSMIARYGWEGFEVISAQEYVPSLGSAGDITSPESVLMIGDTLTSSSRQLIITEGTQHTHRALGTGYPARSVKYHRHTKLTPPVGEHPTSATNDVENCALDILSTIFDYQASPELLCKTFHSLGIDSLAFLRFSEVFERKSGKVLSPSYFTTELTLAEIFAHL